MRSSLEDLKPGMTLAADLLESGGRLLLPAGTVLTDRHLRYFQMWGVSHVDIEGGEAGSADSPITVDPAVQAEVEAALATLFRHADVSHPAVAQVYAHCLAREIRRAVTGAAPHVG
jgi:hypothetical protein